MKTKLFLLGLVALLTAGSVQAMDVTTISKGNRVKNPATRQSGIVVKGMPIQYQNAGTMTATSRDGVYTWDFEDEAQLDNWMALDNDNDGYNWQYFNNTGLETGRMTAHSGEGLVASASYDNDSYTALTPDNWLISPVVDLGGALTFWACGQDASYAAEVFGVYVCVGDPENINDFVQVGPDMTATGEYELYEYDLSAFAGQQGCFAIRHYNVTDQFWLNVDDVTLNTTGVVLPYATMPTNLAVNPAATTADVAWDGAEGDSWTLRYRPYVDPATVSTLWDLPIPGYSEQVADFMIWDADGDGYNWGLTYSDDSQTDACFYSESYVFDWSTFYSASLDPDNWLITPAVGLGGTLKFKVWNSSTSYPDKLAVYVTTNGEWTSADDFVLLQDNIVPGTAPEEYEIDLSAYEGLGYIAFRHYDSYDMMSINLDDIEVIPVGAQQYAEWIYVNDLDATNYTIEGLTPETTYEVQVQASNEKPSVSDWTESVIFTTLAEGQEPTEYCERPECSYAITDFETVTVTITNNEPEATVVYSVYCDGELIEEGTFTGDQYQVVVTGPGDYVVHAVATMEGYLDSPDGGVFFTILPNDVPPVSIDELAGGKTVANVRYFNALGQEMQSANGMTIVVTTYTDGTTSTAKVVK